jgi:lysophospholipase L1-like esterase
MAKVAVVVVALGLLGAACGGGGGSDGIGLKDLNGDGQIQILAFGDSITFGTGDNPGTDAHDPPPGVNGGYPGRLQNLTGVLVVNAGNPGERSGEGRQRLPGVLARNRVDYVILLEGVNDIEFGEEDQTPSNLQTMVDSVFATGAQPILGLLTPTCCNHERSASPERVGDLNQRIQILATADSVPVLDFHSAFGVGPFDDASDTTGLIHVPEGLHPTPAGYDAMAHAAKALFLGD